MDVAHGELLVEKELDAMIERRSRQKDPEEEHDLWRESVERYNAHRREANRPQWCAYFAHLAGALRARAADYDQRAAHLEERSL